MIAHPRHRILFVIGSMGGGGAERQMLEILKRLDRTRFEPLLYLAVKNGELLEEVPADVPIFAYWDGSKETTLGRILRMMKLTRLLRQIHLAQVLHRKKIDLIYDRTYLATLDAAAGCSLRQTPRVSCCVADPGPELELHARWSVAVAWWFARRAYKNASVVLANSEGLRKRFLEYFRVDPDHVKVFYNLLASMRPTAPMADVSDPNLIALSEELGRDFLSSASTATPSNGDIPDAAPESKIFLVVNAGRLHPQKGHIFLIQAVEELVFRRGRKLKLVIFGVGESEAELRDYVRTHQLEPFITIAGFVADPRHWYQKANLFVLPSLFEGMPNALIEAVAIGVPALSTDCTSGPSEILDGGRFGGLVASGDAQALATGIEDAMDHQDKWRARAVLAQKHVEEMFDPEKGIRRLEDLFETIVRQSK